MKSRSKLRVLIECTTTNLLMLLWHRNFELLHSRRYESVQRELLDTNLRLSDSISMDFPTMTSPTVKKISSLWDVFFFARETQKTVRITKKYKSCQNIFRTEIELIINQIKFLFYPSTSYLCETKFFLTLNKKGHISD